MKAYLVGKAVNIEYLATEFAGECVRVSSINEMDWEKFDSADVIFCLFGEFEKPKDYEKRVVSVQLFGSDQAQEISLKSEAEDVDVFYLPFECDKKDIEDLWVMLLAVLTKEELDKDVEGVEEYLEEKAAEDREKSLNTAELNIEESETELDVDDLNSEDLDIDEQEVLEMSSEDDELDIEIGEDDIDLDSDTDVDLDAEVDIEVGDGFTSEVVDLEFSADDEIEVDDDSSDIFVTSSDDSEESEDDADMSLGSDVDLEFGSDDEDDEVDADEDDESVGSLDIDLGGEELEGMDRTGDFDLSADLSGTGEIDISSVDVDFDEDDENDEDEDDAGGDVLAFTGGDSDEVDVDFDLDGTGEVEMDVTPEPEESDHIEMSFSTDSSGGSDEFSLSDDEDEEEDDGDSISVEMEDPGDINLDFSSDDDENTDATMIANDIQKLKEEALAMKNGELSGVPDGESIEAEDGFVLETYDDDEMEDGEDDGDDEDGLDFSGLEGEETGLDLGGDDSGIGIDLSGAVGSGGNSATVTTFQSNDDEPSGINDGIDFSGGSDDFAGFSDDDDDLFGGGPPEIGPEPPDVRPNEVLNFGGISDEKDLMNMHSTIREIREERGEFLTRIQHIEAQNKSLKQENLSMRAELDEKRIELNVIQKRQVADREDLREKLRLSEEKKLLFEEKLRRVEREYEKLEQRIHIDIEKVRKRERELENQLELVRMDAQSQIKTRDSKIMDLKRKIDSLEFNVKTSANREQKNLEEKLRLEARMEKVMDQLRNSIRLLEEEVSVEDIKKIESH